MEGYAQRLLKDTKLKEKIFSWVVGLKKIFFCGKWIFLLIFVDKFYNLRLSCKL